jgi:hypothetical protein
MSWRGCRPTRSQWSSAAAPTPFPGHYAATASRRAWDSGQVYGRLTVLAELPERTRGGRVFRCRCACGRETRARAVELRRGKIRSCGCLLDDARQSGHTRPPRVHSGEPYGRLVVLHEAGRTAHATLGCTAVAATAATRPRCVAPTSLAATPAHADACSRSTAFASSSATPFCSLGIRANVTCSGHRATCASTSSLSWIRCSARARGAPREVAEDHRRVHPHVSRRRAGVGRRPQRVPNRHVLGNVVRRVAERF